MAVERERRSQSPRAQGGVFTAINARREKKNDPESREKKPRLFKKKKEPGKRDHQEKKK